MLTKEWLARCPRPAGNRDLLDRDQGPKCCNPWHWDCEGRRRVLCNHYINSSPIHEGPAIGETEKHAVSQLLRCRRAPHTRSDIVANLEPAPAVYGDSVCKRARRHYGSQWDEAYRYTCETLYPVWLRKSVSITRQQARLRLWRKGEVSAACWIHHGCGSGKNVEGGVTTRLDL